jgi:ABC-type uncharacterized transport system permease subunit
VDRIYLALACIPYGLVSAYACYALGARHFRPGKGHLALIGAGFLLHTVFLHLRGQMIGHCPITNLFEVMVFVSWALVLNYLLLGPVFRCSVLGLFCMPVVFIINAAALAFPGIDYPSAMPAMGPMLELHASLSVMAYGTLGLSAVAAFVYLIEDRALKSRAVAGLLDRLPDLGKLDRLAQRIALLGFLLLTVGLAFGFLMDHPVADTVKILWSVAVWLLYACLLGARWAAKLSPLRFADILVWAYLFVLLTFWAVNFWSHSHRFGT